MLLERTVTGEQVSGVQLFWEQYSWIHFSLFEKLESIQKKANLVSNSGGLENFDGCHNLKSIKFLITLALFYHAQKIRNEYIC